MCRPARCVLECAPVSELLKKLMDATDGCVVRRDHVAKPLLMKEYA